MAKQLLAGVPTPLIVAIASIFQDDVGTVNKTRLERFRDQITRHSQDEVKDVLRNKKDEEKLAPFRKTLMGLGMQESTAKTRHNECRIIWDAYLTGFPLGKQTDWHKCVDAARQHKQNRKETTAKAAERAEKVGVILEMEELYADPIKAREAAEVEFLARKQHKEMDRKEALISKAAEKLGYKAFLYAEGAKPVEIAVGLLEQFGPVISSKIGAALVQKAERMLAKATPKAESKPVASEPVVVVPAVKQQAVA